MTACKYCCLDAADLATKIEELGQKLSVQKYAHQKLGNERNSRIGDLEAMLKRRDEDLATKTGAHTKLIMWLRENEPEVWKRAQLALMFP